MTRVFHATFLIHFAENPTPKFGEALRAQVEERLAFFDSGAPPTKNAEALRRVLEELGLDEDNEEEQEENSRMDIYEEPILTTLDAEPKKERKRKRKQDDMDVDDDDDHSDKKVKLSKEEKKALKKAKKEKAKAVAAADGVSLCLFENLLLFNLRLGRTGPKEEGEEREEREEEEKGMNLFVILSAVCLYFLRDVLAAFYMLPQHRIRLLFTKGYAFLPHKSGQVPHFIFLYFGDLFPHLLGGLIGVLEITSITQLVDHIHLHMLLSLLLDLEFVVHKHLRTWPLF